MPLRGTKDAPKFLGKVTAELLRFLEDVGILADQAQLDDTGKIRAAIRYAALDEAKLWETLDSAAAVSAVWADFVTAVKQLYPGCEDADRYYHSDLHNLVQEYQVKPMKNREELALGKRVRPALPGWSPSCPRSTRPSLPTVQGTGCTPQRPLPHDKHPRGRQLLSHQGFSLTGLLPLWIQPATATIPATTSICPAEELGRSATDRWPDWNSIAHNPTPGDGGEAGDPSHFVPNCELALAYINEGKLSRRNGCLCMANGSPILRIQGIYGMRNVVDHLLARPAVSTEPTPSSGFTELEIEPSAFLHTSSMSLRVPDSSEVADPEFQAFLANTWVNFQARKGKGDQSNGKKTWFDGVEVPRRKAPRVTIEEEIESPAVRGAHALAGRRPLPLSQSHTPESQHTLDPPSSSSRAVILAPPPQRAPGEGQPITKPVLTTAPVQPTPTAAQQEPSPLDTAPCTPSAPAMTAQPTNVSSVPQSSSQFRYSFPLADSEAPKHALDQVLGVTVPVPLKELLALSPDLRKHMKEAVTGKRVWGNLLTQARSESPARAEVSANCFELEGQDPEAIARDQSQHPPSIH
ncbi:hypothetical protein PAXRUDRAFT_20124 [Paxillus rubicundulus Ve08.2h10]|uniref:DUF4100 domain-containing protein n=1 Tax=Paxillus rubicundulus Ve08.2h10 TaxID=930991 RepID=A0A0D0CT54_9AGAM|nr:hypothetical protein PAXRUDRAFT_20124 [Paxillus rubicundulus Ve08.2h10]